MDIIGKVIIFVLIVVNVTLSLFLLLRNYSFPILDPAGPIAMQQRDLILLVGAIGFSIVIPVIATTFFIAWKYREDNPKAKYNPNLVKSRKFEFFRWGLLIFVIAISSFITWESSHRLDPYKPLTSDVKPIRIQVVALQWKWLFIYPDQQIATVNFVEFPEKTPVNFELTADAPMNSFWIPALGGQIYAMNGMSTKIHLMADRTGEFAGSDAEISGIDFVKMKFVAKSVTQHDFDLWVRETQKTQSVLDYDSFTELAIPGTEFKSQYYTLGDHDLYNKIMAKYMSHGAPQDEKVDNKSNHDEELEQKDIYH